MHVLVVCSANRCRSPMGAAFLRAELMARGVDSIVRSGGFGPAGEPATPETVEVMAAAGIDLSDHRSHHVTAEDCAGADLVIGMTRQHVIELVVLDPASWPRIFPIVDLLRRGGQMGARRNDEPVATWIHRAHGGRQRASVLTLPRADDITDPIGHPLSAFKHTRDQLHSLVTDLAGLLAPELGPDPLQNPPSAL